MSMIEGIILGNSIIQKEPEKGFSQENSCGNQGNSERNLPAKLPAKETV